jgi:UDPglucose 6-dehydrogenase
VLVTDWPEFQSLPLATLAPRMRYPLMVDARNCLEHQILQQAGFEYIGIGR